MGKETNFVDLTAYPEKPVFHNVILSEAKNLRGEECRRQEMLHSVQHDYFGKGRK